MSTPSDVASPTLKCLRSFAKGERGELIVFFHHPITKTLQFDGLIFDGEAEPHVAGEE